MRHQWPSFEDSNTQYALELASKIMFTTFIQLDLFLLE